MNYIKDNFSIISNKIINDCNLSYGAKGVACYLLSKDNIDNWKYYMKDIQNHSNETMSKIKKYIKELEEIGFLTRVKTKNEQGKFDGLKYIFNVDYLFDDLKDRQLENRQLENATVGKTSDIIINNINNTKITNNECKKNNNINVDNDKSNKLKDNDLLEITENIKILVENKKRIVITNKQLNEWYKEVEKLYNSIKDLRGEKEAKDDMKKALVFLFFNKNDIYTPVVESGKTFKEKFLKIEEAMKRKMGSNIDLSGTFLSGEDLNEWRF